MSYIRKTILFCTVALPLVWAGQFAEAAGKGRPVGGNALGKPPGFVQVPGAPAQVAINRSGEVSLQRVTPRFNDIAAKPGPRIRRDFKDNAFQPVPRVLIKPDKTKEVLPGPGYAKPSRKLENGKLTEKNGGLAIYTGKGRPWTRIHPPTAPRGTSPAYPNGYITQGFKHGKSVHPKTYKEIPNWHPLAHRDLGAKPSAQVKKR